jgi:hypothetical protein
MEFFNKDEEIPRRAAGALFLSNHLFLIISLLFPHHAQEISSIIFQPAVTI